jgi:hypothetical protein
MSQAIVGGLIGAAASVAIVKRVREIKMFYATSGTYNNVIIAVCVDKSCIVDHTDVNGDVHRNVQLFANDMIIGGSVTVLSGRMFIMAFEAAGMV